MTDDTQTCRVLMVDDEELILRMAAGMARRIQLNLVTAGTPEDAITAARSTPIDVLITDVQLGDGLDGIELAREIAALHPGLSVILMSGYGAAQFDLQDLPAGIEFLTKPFNGESLARSIAAVRSHASATQQA